MLWPMLRVKRSCTSRSRGAQWREAGQDGKLRRRIAKITAYALMSIAAIILIAVSAAYYRLTRGPVTLNAFASTIQQRINANLSGMAVEIGGLVLELPPGDDLPRLRLRDLVLRDTKGSVIARAPRAAVGIDGPALWALEVKPRTLELIGPRIFVKRNLNGGMELGFGNLAETGDEQGNATALPPGTGDGKSDREEAVDAPAPSPMDIVPNIPGATLMQILSGSPQQDASGIGTMEDIRVTGAALSFFDEPNNAIWNAEKADLAFRRMPYGFAVVTTGSVLNGSQPGSWHMELSASYRRDSRSFSISARMYDLVPSYVSEKVFALAQFARVKVPLSGHAEFEITESGELTKATAEFAAAAGEVGLPDYLARPVVIDEGALRADYDPASGAILISDSSLLVGGSRAELSGKISPQRTAEGRLAALGIQLTANNINIDAQGTVVSPVSVDRVEFDGVAGIDVARLDVNDLVVMKGNSGVRLRGSITGGGQSPGLLISGRVRDLSAGLLKKLWPPILAPKTRAWVNENVQDGRISDGSIQINLPVDAIARADRVRRFDKGAVDVRFQLADVSSKYFKDLPLLEKASGLAHLSDNNFSLTVDKGVVNLPDGSALQLASADLSTIDILAAETRAEIDVSTQSKIKTLLTYLNQPGLALIASSGIDTSKLSGDVAAHVNIKMPLIKDVPASRVVVTGEAKLTGAALKGALDKIDITNGNFDLVYKKGQLDGSGPAKINGIDAKIVWHRDAGKGAKQSATISASLDASDRAKMGIDVSDFLDGPIAASVTIPDLATTGGPIAIKADLSKVDLRIDAVSWSRPATPGTTATLNYFGPASQGGRRVEDLAVKGTGVAIMGKIMLSDQGSMREANLSRLELGENNAFAMRVKPIDGGVSVSIDGAEFDARPLIKTLFGAAKAFGGERSRQTLQINASIDRVYANRGEEIKGLTAAITTVGGQVKSADMAGTFLSGQPIVMRITPRADGRELTVTGRDAGAALRAANLYSKMAGGQLDFHATMANNARSSIRNGGLVIRDFGVRNEAALAELDQKGKPRKSGPRREGMSFRKLNMPFTADEKFLRIGDSILQGPDIGATFGGLIRKADGAIDITGTIIPVYALNSALGEIPILGNVITGGKGQGIIGITFALGGTVEKSKFQMNPVSAIAPGFLRKLFEFERSGKKPAAPAAPSQSSNK